MIGITPAQWTVLAALGQLFAGFLTVVRTAQASWAMALASRPLRLAVDPDFSFWGTQYLSIVNQPYARVELVFVNARSGMTRRSHLG